MPPAPLTAQHRGPYPAPAVQARPFLGRALSHRRCRRAGGGGEPGGGGGRHEPLGRPVRLAAEGEGAGLQARLVGAQGQLLMSLQQVAWQAGITTPSRAYHMLITNGGELSPRAYAAQPGRSSALGSIPRPLPARIEPGRAACIFVREARQLIVINNRFPSDAARAGWRAGGARRQAPGLTVNARRRETTRGRQAREQRRGGAAKFVQG